MSTNSDTPNFRLLLAIFDEKIYSSLSDDEISRRISSSILWDDILGYFPNKQIFLSTLTLYQQTIITEISDNDNFRIQPLVISCKADNITVEIEHNTSALLNYLSPKDNFIIENSYIEDVFLNALSRFNMRSDILYSIVSRRKKYEISPEELKKELGINYVNSLLKSRILLPVQKSINNLYEEGLIPFYININVKRSVMGRGSKIKGIEIEVINDIDLLRIKRKRPEYMQYIMSQLIKLFPFDYPFLEEDIKKTDNETVKDIYHMIKYIDKDPDYRKLETSTLIRYKLQQEYGIKILMS